MSEVFRVLDNKGLFCCDLISGNDINHSKEYCEEVLVKKIMKKILYNHILIFQRLTTFFKDYFKILECALIKREDILTGDFFSRYHLVFKKK